MSEQKTKVEAQPEYYQCPDEKSRLTRVMCLARQAHNYEHCAQCPHRVPPHPKPELMRRLRV